MSTTHDPKPEPEASASITITLDARDIAMVQRYRQARATMNEAVNTAIKNAGDRVWSAEDQKAVDDAQTALNRCEMEMCAVLEFAARNAGV